jgi:basic amino acid/polyamine antiporter, APA family
MLNELGVSSAWGAALMSLGAVISIVGVYDVFTLSVARLTYALAVDGLFPAPFARLHNRFGTPWVGLAFQAGSALVATWVFNLSGLIATSVFFLGICYVITAVAALRLLMCSQQLRLRLHGLRPALALAGLGGAYLAAQAPWRGIAVGSVALAAGLTVYGLRHGAWREAAVVAGGLYREEQVFRRGLCDRRSRTGWVGSGCAPTRQLNKRNGPAPD